MTSPEDGLADVCVAISSFRNDDSILALLRTLYSRQPFPFQCVMVVDSLGTGVVPKVAKESGWDRFEYASFDHNLGSAGNLRKRLELAARSGAKYVYATNHDGGVDPSVVATLRRTADEHANVGAVFPLRRMTAQDGRYDVTGRFRVPLFAVRVKAKPRGTVLPVHWSSSNGALYSLEPVRRGLLPWDDLWMGYEDLGYGWLLEQNGYEQLLVVDSIADDGYEYGRRGGMYLAEKAPWYAYYFARNFLVVAERTKQPLPIRAAVLGRVLGEFLISATLRRDRVNRIRFLSAGLRDAFLGRMHKWTLP